MGSLGESALDKYGQVRVRDTLELIDYPGTLTLTSTIYLSTMLIVFVLGIFCVGDAVSNAERNRLGKYPRHARVVIPNLLARLDGAEPRTTYGGSIETLRVSIGSVSDICWYIGILKVQTVLNHHAGPRRHDLWRAVVLAMGYCLRKLDDGQGAE